MAIEVVSSGPLSPQNAALYDAGKQLLVDSVSTGRDFCKFMVGGATGAIPVYLGLLTFALPKDYRPGLWQGIGMCAPAVALLIAALVFALGAFPVKGSVSLDVPATIEQELNDAMSRHARFSKIGFLIFSAATVASIGVVVWSLSVQATPAPVKPTVVQIVK
jgi:hypothetical protein